MKYNPTSVIFLKIPTISHLQWHSFSIISSQCHSQHQLHLISMTLSTTTTSSHINIIINNNIISYQEESEACTDLDQQVSEARIILQEEEKHHGEAERGQNR